MPLISSERVTAILAVIPHDDEPIAFHADFILGAHSQNIMDIPLFIKALLMGLVEGLTEFLPVSSTGHLIVAGSLLHFPADLASTFEVVVQAGSLLALVLYFSRDLITLLRRALTDHSAQKLLLNLTIAFVPVGIVGVLVGKAIKASLFTPTVVALSLIVGGVLLLWVDGYIQRRLANVTDVEQVNWRQALAIGISQVTALIPGVSRSASTLVGGLLSGLDRPTALRFSFYLAIPTLGAATIFDLLSSLKHLPAGSLPILGIGLASSFVAGLIVIRFFLRYIAQHRFRSFAVYRILAGLILLGLVQIGFLR